MFNFMETCYFSELEHIESFKKRQATGDRVTGAFSKIIKIVKILQETPRIRTVAISARDSL